MQVMTFLRKAVGIDDFSTNLPSDCYTNPASSFGLVLLYTYAHCPYSFGTRVFPWKNKLHTRPFW